MKNKRLTEKQIKEIESQPIRLAEMKFDMPEDMPMNPDTVVCSIDMLRTGNFVRESYFGSYLLKIDEMLMDKMIENFNAKVIKRGVPLDVNHNKTEAYAWLQSLSKEYRDLAGKQQCYLVGQWELNKKGIEMIGDKVYNLFSLEFSYNYKDNEVDASFVTPEGGDVPVGAMRTYGPTIIGGALTNRPFIPDLGPIQFSEDSGLQLHGLEVGYFEKMREGLKDHSYMFNVEMMTDQGQPQSSKQEKPVVNSFSKEEEKKVIAAKIDADILMLSGLKINTKPEKRNQMNKLAELLAKLEQNLSKLDPKSQEFTDAKSAIDEVKAELSQFADDNKAKDALLKKSEGHIAELTTRVVKNENSLSEMNIEMSMQREKSRQAEVGMFASTLPARGFPKPMIDKVKEVLLANKNTDVVMELSAADGTKKSLTVRGLVEEILSVFPEGKKVPLGEGMDFTFGKKNSATGDIELTSEEALSAQDAFEKKNAAAIERGTKKGLKSLNQ
jgi:hypothetical protein